MIARENGARRDAKWPYHRRVTCAESDELEPPWSRHPWIPLGSIGWRMGTGEGYQIRWGQYVERAIPDVPAALVYLRRHPPAPRTWLRFVASWLAEVAGEAFDDDRYEDEESEVGARWRARVVEERLVGDDVAYFAWVRNALSAGGMVVPWGRREDPHDALRHSARELGWWGRWLATQCDDRDAWLDEQPEPPAAWARIAGSARSRLADPPWEHGGVEALVATIAATGTLPPPWRAGHEPLREIRWDDDADDRDRWAWWAFDTFEDRASWERYIAPWPPPDDWQRVLTEEHFHRIP